MHTPIQSHSRTVETTQAALERAVARWRLVDPPVEELGWELNEWTLDLNSLRLLLSVLQELQPRVIVEFGGGLSTRVFAWASTALCPGARVWSWDHDPDFFQRTLEDLKRSAPGSDVNCRLAPLVLRKAAGAWVPMYALRQALLSDVCADLILIDGPPHGLGGRQGALVQAMEFAHPGTLVLLDDANRPTEEQALAFWTQTFAGAIDVRRWEGFRKGVATIVIREPVRLSELEDYRARLAAREFASIVKPESHCLLMDDFQYPTDMILPGRVILRLGSEPGQPWGAPPNDPSALDELNHLTAQGVDYVLISSSSFWWLEHYPRFGQKLRTTGELILNNARWRVFQMRSAPQKGPTQPQEIAL